ncbi:MAG TPA: 4'-phosphopantetheinyl transferase superfamily protein [Solirubrobacteraceae bacterium]|jgi:4'-phosphopantetheinyl transferase|nr:4'-phosphopantetheinyl transferase superfamily protein [Solirubrobacteraceae bacterium]
MCAGTSQQSAPGPRPAAWPIGPHEPSIRERDLHVWRADLEHVGEDLSALLNNEERERGERIASDEARVYWMRSRGVLRALLGRYLRRDPRTLAFDRGPYGKPALSVAEESRGLSFSLSHSEQFALYAFTTSGSVGVDAEVTMHARTTGRGRHERDHVALARRIFGEQQAQRLAALAPDDRELEFLRLWTSYEAELKRRGRGIAAGTIEPMPAPWIAELDVGPSAAAAVACEITPRELRRWRWR